MVWKMEMGAALLMAGLVGCGDAQDDTAGFTDIGDLSTGTETGDEGGSDTDTGSDTGVMCSEPLVECGGECVDTNDDVNHCGACDNSCADAEACEAGTCTAASWRGPVLLEQDDMGDAANPHIAANGVGDAVVVWSQSDVNALTHIGAIRYDREAEAWTSAKPIEFDNAGPATKPEVSVDPSGNAVAVWEQSNGGFLENTRSNRYDVAAGAWGDDQALELDNTGNASDARVSVSPTGDAHAVWMQTSGSLLNAWSNRFNAATGTWGTAQPLGSDALFPAVLPDIAATDDGGALAVWLQWDGARNNLWASQFSTATGLWDIPNLLEDSDLASATAPQIETDASGGAVAVWVQGDGTHDRVWGSRFDPTAGTWGAPVLFAGKVAGDAMRPTLALNDAGDAVVAWMQWSDGKFGISGARFVSATQSWTPPESLAVQDNGTAWDPHAGISSQGDITVGWRQRDGTHDSAWARRYNATSEAWGDATPLETEDLGDAESPFIAVDDQGRAFAVWTQFDGTRMSLYANVYR